MKVRFEKRDVPLEPVLAAGRGQVAFQLFEKAKRDPGCRCLAAPGLFLILSSELPWVPGIEYLGQCEGLYLPTTLKPVPEELFIDRILKDYGPAAILSDFTVIGISGPAELRESTLSRWHSLIEGKLDE